MPLIFELREIVALFEANIGRYLTNAELAERLNTSQYHVRALIKYMRFLGFAVDTIDGEGHILRRPLPLISETAISHFCKGYELPLQYHIFDSLPSTNTTAKELATDGAPEGTLVLAEHQTAGRGRRGHDFYSPEATGIYMSLVLKPSMAAVQATRITAAAAASVTEALYSLSRLDTQIKWVNDVFLNNKKICGILCEAALPDYVVLGIGLNLYPPYNGFPTELSETAGVAYPSGGQELRNQIIAEILIRFFKYYRSLDNKEYLEVYRKRSLPAGTAICVHRGGAVKNAVIVGLDDECGLIVSYPDGGNEILTSGEVSIRKVLA